MEGGGAEIPRGRRGLEMSPLPEVLEPPRVHYGAVEEDVHPMGAAPGGAVGFARDRPEGRGGGGNMFRRQLRDDQIPLIPEEEVNRQRGSLKACCKKFRTDICESTSTYV